MKTATKITTIFLFSISALHALRIIFDWPVIANGIVVPIWISYLGVFVPAALAVMIIKEHK
jgi:hypothetical protein